MRSSVGVGVGVGVDVGVGVRVDAGAGAGVRVRVRVSVEVYARLSAANALFFALVEFKRPKRIATGAVGGQVASQAKLSL